MHEAFKRRIKTQTVLPSAKTAAMLFWALLASGQITMLKVNGWQTLSETLPLTSPPSRPNYLLARNTPLSQFPTQVATAPLDATLGDHLDKTVAQGGMHRSRLFAYPILLAITVACVLFIPQRAAKHGERSAAA